MQTAQELIADEVSRQDRMWGSANERADRSKRQLLHAGIAQLIALEAKQDATGDAFAPDGLVASIIYPKDWCGFRDYGSDIANLVVAAAYIQQEIKRKLALGEDTTRWTRDQATQAYAAPNIPAVQEP